MSTDEEQDPTEEMVKREVAEAMRIFRSDHDHVTTSVRGLLEEFFGEKKPKEETDDTPTPPPAKEDPPKATKKRKGIWWGDAME